MTLVKLRSIFEYFVPPRRSSTKFEDSPAGNVYRPGHNSYAMTFIGDDDTTRGDSQALKGLGRLCAQKTGREWKYLDAAEIVKLYPELPKEQGYQRFFETEGYPEMVFCSPEEWLPVFKSSFVVRGMNERIGPEDNNIPSTVVAHHLNDALLNDEARKFEQHYPKIKGEIIALMHITCEDRITGADRTQDITDKIINAIRHNKNTPATIFICGTRRTNYAQQENLVGALKNKIQTLGLDNMIGVESFAMSDKDNRQAYNPLWRIDRQS